MPGIMGKRISAFDWSKTPLGSIEQWPLSLKHVLMLVLGTAFPNIIFWGPKLIAIYNDSFKPMLGAKRESLGRTMPDVFSDVWDELRPLAEKAIAGEASSFMNAHFTILRYEYPEEAWFDFSLSALRDDSGSITGILLTSIEKTGKVHAEQNLKHSEAQFRSIFDSNILAFAFWKKDGLLTEANQIFCNMVGYSTQEIKDLKVKWADVTPADKIWSELLCLDEINTNGCCSPSEKEFVNRDGRLISVLIGGAFSRDKDNYVTYVIDITRQKEAETILREEKEHFRVMADEVPVIIWVSDKNANHMISNRAFREYYGFDMVNMTEQGRQKLSIHPDDLPNFKKIRDQAIREESPFTTVLRLRRKDGKFLWFLMRGEPRRGKSGEFIGHVGVNVEINERIEAEKALRKSKEELRILYSNLEEIVIQRTEQARSLSAALTMAEQRERKKFSTVLHEDLQQRLFAIRMLLSEYLREREETAVQTLEEDNVAEARSMLDQALKTTKSLSVELNPPVLRTQGLDVALQWLISHFRKTYGLQVTFEMVGAVHTIKGETQIMLTQMIHELLENVIKHSGVLQASLEVHVDEHRVRTMVCDKGRGFNPEAVYKKSDIEFKLGLFGIKERLKLFGGELTVSSAKNKGTKCFISLPLKPY